MSKPRLLDLFCGAGGASMGYSRAGFEVVGVDIKPQKHYPFPFVQDDALSFLQNCGWHFDAIHASPPCQAFSAMRRGRWQDREHPDLIEPTRLLLRESGKPYVIENVPGAPLVAPVMLCGTMFDLKTASGAWLRRHRLFETSFPLRAPGPCQHDEECSAIGVHGGGQHPKRRRVIGVYGHAGGRSSRDGVSCFGAAARREAMGIDWMTQDELSLSIPPAYTEYIGKSLLAELHLTP